MDELCQVTSRAIIKYEVDEVRIPSETFHGNNVLMIDLFQDVDLIEQVLPGLGA